MRQPLDGNIVITGEFKEKAQPGTGLADANGVKRHIGVDMRAGIGTKVFAPGAGVIVQSYSSAAGQTIEARIAGKLWRFMHLSKRNYSAGQKFNEGAVLGLSGNSGGVAAHLHVDCRTDNTAWNASLNNYQDFRNVIAEANKPKPAPGTGKRVYFSPAQTATFYKVSGGTFAMKCANNESWNVLEDQGYRVRVNSKSAGGDCWVYIIWQNGSKKGQKIDGRTVR